MKIVIGIFLLINLAVLLSCASNGQGIRLSKGILYVDNVATPIRIDMEYKAPKEFHAFHQSYRFYDRNTEEPFLIVDYKGVQLPGSYKKVVWLEISDAEGGRMNSVEFKGGLISSKSLIIKEMIDKYRFFDRAGIVRYDRIAEFMETEIQAQAKHIATSAMVETSRDAELLEAVDLFVGSDLVVKKGGVLGDPIGRLEVLHDDNQKESFRVGVYDLAENQIAYSKMNPRIPMVEVNLIDGRRFEYYTHYGLSAQLGGAGFMKELVEQVVLKGFSLGYSYDESAMTSDEPEVHEAL